jgi:hypothetical protein
MDFRGTAIAGVWIGTAGIVAALNYFGGYAEASIPVIIVAFILTINIMRQSPGGQMEEEMKANMASVGERVLALERKVDEIVRLLEE